MTYDPQNIFAKILCGEIPCNRVYEDDFALAFHDIAPSAPHHLVVIPKLEASCFADFMAKATPAEVHGFFAGVATVAAQLGGQADFRLITNNGAAAGQTVHHFHVHVLAGKPLGPLLAD